MLVVDPTVRVDYFNGQVNPETNYLDQILAEEELLVGDLILAETLQGFRDDRDFELAQSSLARSEQAEMLNLRLARLSAHNYRALRKRGISIRKTIDCIIATFCIEEDYSLLHRDNDFNGFEQYLGLKVVHAGRE